MITTTEDGAFLPAGCQNRNLVHSGTYSLLTDVITENNGKKRANPIDATTVFTALGRYS